MVIIHTDTFFPTAPDEDWHFLSEKVEGDYEVLTYVLLVEGGFVIAEHGSGYTKGGIPYFDEGMSFVPEKTKRSSGGLR